VVKEIARRFKARRSKPGRRAWRKDPEPEKRISKFFRPQAVDIPRNAQGNVFENLEVMPTPH